MNLTRTELEQLIRQIVEEYIGDETLSVEEAAAMLGYTKRTLYNKIRFIPHKKLPSGKLTFSRNELIKYISHE